MTNKKYTIYKVVVLTALVIGAFGIPAMAAPNKKLASQNQYVTTSNHDSTDDDKITAKKIVLRPLNTGNRNLYGLINGNLVPVSNASETTASQDSPDCRSLGNNVVMTGLDLANDNGTIKVAVYCSTITLAN